MRTLARRVFLKKSSQAGMASLIGVWSFPEFITGMAGNSKLRQKTKEPIEQIIGLGEKRLLKSDYGPVAFGLVVSASLVSWSGKNTYDLLLYRLGNGYFLYPSENLDDVELAANPIKVSPPVKEFLPYEVVAMAADWNKDGFDDLIVGGMTGYLYYMERKGVFPNLSFEFAAPLKDDEKNLIFNIPYDNPNHPVMNNLNGYFDTAFFNYPTPISYPLDDSTRINLIIGDWAGNLWWMPDLSDGRSKPFYRGKQYVKPKEEIVSVNGKRLAEEFGCEYVKPEGKICDENGEPFLLGDGFDTGFEYKGGVTRPVLYYNKFTGTYDLIVLAGVKQISAYYLQRVNTGEKDKPAFKNLGKINFEGFEGLTEIGCHAKMVVYNMDGWNNILLPANNNIVIFKNKRTNSIKPEFKFDRQVNGKDVYTSGYNFTEILTDVKGKRYLLDNPNELQLREIKTDGGELKLSSERIRIRDQFGVFRPEGETDPQGGKDWGFHRASRWDFDGSGRQHLIVGTDKGLLYLLIEEEKLGTGGEFKYKSVGPLKDTEGDVIKIHNRACAAGIDLNGNGTEDLVVGGVTYQLGSVTDPNPGGGFYYLLHKGLDERGIPKLEKAKSLKIRGHEFDIYTNSHVHLKALQLFEGEGRQIILAAQRDGFKARIFKPIPGETGLEYTGRMIEKLSVEDNLVDINGDGQLEFVFGGGEEGVAYYRELKF